MVKEEHIPLHVFMGAFALKAGLITMFGKQFSEDKDILEFERNYQIVSLSLNYYKVLCFRYTMYSWLVNENQNSIHMKYF